MTYWSHICRWRKRASMFDTSKFGTEVTSTLNVDFGTKFDWDITTVAKSAPCTMITCAELEWFSKAYLGATLLTSWCKKRMFMTLKWWQNNHFCWLFRDVATEGNVKIGQWYRFDLANWQLPYMISFRIMSTLFVFKNLSRHHFEMSPILVTLPSLSIKKRIFMFLIFTRRKEWFILYNYLQKLFKI